MLMFLLVRVLNTWGMLERLISMNVEKRERLWCYCEGIHVLTFCLWYMSSTDLADIMVKKKALVGVGSLIFSPEVLVQTSGFIKHLGCFFNKLVKNNKRYKEFHFKNDPSLSYTYLWEDYIGFFSNTLIFDSTAKFLFFFWWNNFY